MTYTNTYTPRVAMPRHDARVTATPRTEQEYARLLDAICRKEGKRGKLPDNTRKGSAVARKPRDYSAHIKAIRAGSVTTQSIADILQTTIGKARNALDKMHKLGMIQYDKSNRQWEIVQ